MTDLVLSALHQVPTKDLWGVIVYFYTTPIGTLAHYFCGSFIEYDEKTKDLVEHEDVGTFEDIRREIEFLKDDNTFNYFFSVDFGKHVDFGTDCARIARRIR